MTTIPIFSEAAWAYVTEYADGGELCGACRYSDQSGPGSGHVCKVVAGDYSGYRDLTPGNCPALPSDLYPEVPEYSLVPVTVEAVRVPSYALVVIPQPVEPETAEWDATSKHASLNAELIEAENQYRLVSQELQGMKDRVRVMEDEFEATFADKNREHLVLQHEVNQLLLMLGEDPEPLPEQAAQPAQPKQQDATDSPPLIELDDPDMAVEPPPDAPPEVINEAKKKEEADKLAKEREAKIKKLYKKIAQRCHPDRHKVKRPDLIELFNEAKHYYKSKDLEGLELIWDLVTGKGNSLITKLLSRLESVKRDIQQKVVVIQHISRSSTWALLQHYENPATRDLAIRSAGMSIDSIIENLHLRKQMLMRKLAKQGAGNGQETYRS